MILLIEFHPQFFPFLSWSTPFSRVEPSFSIGVTHITHGRLVLKSCAEGHPGSRWHALRSDRALVLLQLCVVLRFQTFAAFANLVHSRVHLKYLENVGELQVVPPISGEIAADFSCWVCHIASGHPVDEYGLGWNCSSRISPGYWLAGYNQRIGAGYTITINYSTKPDAEKDRKGVSCRSFPQFSTVFPFPFCL